MTAPMCAEHRCHPPRECDGVALAGHGSPCRCGHSQKAHEHYTERENCSVCACPEYSDPNALRWIAAAAVVGVVAFVVVVVGIWAVARILAG